MLFSLNDIIILRSYMVLNDIILSYTILCYVVLLYVTLILFYLIACYSKVRYTELHKMMLSYLDITSSCIFHDEATNMCVALSSSPSLCSHAADASPCNTTLEKCLSSSGHPRAIHCLLQDQGTKSDRTAANMQSAGMHGCFLDRENIPATRQACDMFHSLPLKARAGLPTICIRTFSIAKWHAKPLYLQRICKCSRLALGTMERPQGVAAEADKHCETKLHRELSQPSARRAGDVQQPTASHET